MALLLLFMMVASCAANTQDLSGQMLTFPEETNMTYVRVNVSAHTFTALTVCFRFVTDLTRSHSLFSLATPAAANAFEIRNSPESSAVYVYVNNRVVRFRGLSSMVNRWHAMCSSWDGQSGVVKVWLDAEATISRFVGGGEISDPVVILGQDQDSMGGHFQKWQSFVGMLADVHMWDYALSACEIQNFMDDLNFTPGSVLNWRALEFHTAGRVILEEKMLACR